jgi:hypothetical protein
MDKPRHFDAIFTSSLTSAPSTLKLYVHTVTFLSVFIVFIISFFTLERMQTLSFYDRSCSLFNILKIFSVGPYEQGVKTLKGTHENECTKTMPVCTYSLNLSIFYKTSTWVRFSKTNLFVSLVLRMFLNIRCQKHYSKYF